MDGHISSSKFNYAIREGTYFTSFDTNEIKEYFNGDMYCHHPIQDGRSYLFLKKPENRIKGISTNGTAPDTDLASVITLPNNNPRELPANETKNVMK
jgi:hypothetical protein